MNRSEGASANRNDSTTHTAVQERTSFGGQNSKPFSNLESLECFYTGLLEVNTWTPIPSYHQVEPIFHRRRTLP